MDHNGDQSASLIFSRKTIVTICIIVGTIIAIEPAFCSPTSSRASSISHAKFLSFGELQIAALAVIFALVAAIVLNFWNWVARFKNKIALILICFAIFWVMVFGKTKIDFLFQGYHSPGMLTQAAGIWIMAMIASKFGIADTSEKQNSGNLEIPDQ